MRQTKQNGRKRFRKKLTRRLRKKRAMKGGIIDNNEENPQDSENPQNQENSQDSEILKLFDENGLLIQANLNSFVSNNKFKTNEQALLKIFTLLFTVKDVTKLKSNKQYIFVVIKEFNKLFNAADSLKNLNYDIELYKDANSKILSFIPNFKYIIDNESENYDSLKTELDLFNTNVETCMKYIQKKLEKKLEKKQKERKEQERKEQEQACNNCRANNPLAHYKCNALC